MNLTCLIRKELVAATPEERVRQQLIATMIQQLEYPGSCFAIEKELHQLPHLKFKKIPQRRLDLLCYANDNHSLFPLLLVECKAIPLTSKVLNQVCGYNAHVKAYFVAVANPQEVRLGWMTPSKEYRFIAGLPPYPVLLEMIKSGTDPRHI